MLTYNRPRSLLRLLRSLEAAHYTFPSNNPGWELILEIRCMGHCSLLHREYFVFIVLYTYLSTFDISRVDGGGGEDGKRVVNIAKNFNFSHGRKKIVIGKK